MTEGKSFRYRMVVLPEYSSASLRRGAWFVFTVDAHRVHAWFSVTTGRSKIYVDDECVRSGHCFRPRGHFDVACDGLDFRVHFTVARQGRLFVTLQGPDGEKSSQCAAFQVPPWAWVGSVAVDLICAYFLTVSVYEDTLSPWLALVTFLVVIFMLTSVERCVFGRLRIVEIGPTFASMAD